MNRRNFFKTLFFSISGLLLFKKLPEVNTTKYSSLKMEMITVYGKSLSVNEFGEFNLSHRWIPKPFHEVQKKHGGSICRFN